MSIALRSLKFLDVLSSTPAGFSVARLVSTRMVFMRALCTRLGRFAYTKPCEKGGLAAMAKDDMFCLVCFAPYMQIACSPVRIQILKPFAIKWTCMNIEFHASSSLLPREEN